MDSIDAVSEILREASGKKISLLHPKRGPRAALTSMADLKARQLLETRIQEKDSVERKLGEVQKRLRLPRLPRRIECVDISHLAGKDTVGAISAVIDGLLLFFFIVIVIRDLLSENDNRVLYGFIELVPLVIFLYFFIKDIKFFKIRLFDNFL